MPFLIISVFLMVIASWGKQTVNLWYSGKAQRLVVLSAGQALIASEVRRYQMQTGTFPASLAAMSATSGFQHLKQYVPQVNGGAFKGTVSPWSINVSNTLSDGTYQFQRAATVALADGTVSLATYLSYANNTCNPSGSTLAYASAVTWCGSNVWGYWASTDTLDLRTQREGLAYKQQNWTAAKFTRAFNTTSTLPVMAAATTLASLVSPIYTGATVGTSSTTCSGQFYWQGIGFECSDLYNQFGNPVSYVRSSALTFTLSSVSQILSTAGPNRALTTTVVEP